MVGKKRLMEGTKKLPIVELGFGDVAIGVVPGNDVVAITFSNVEPTEIGAPIIAKTVDSAIFIHNIEALEVLEHQIQIAKQVLINQKIENCICQKLSENGSL